MKLDILSVVALTSVPTCLIPELAFRAAVLIPLKPVLTVAIFVANGSTALVTSLTLSANLAIVLELLYQI
jgi:hypothetical protein